MSEESNSWVFHKLPNTLGVPNCIPCTPIKDKKKKLFKIEFSKEGSERREVVFQELTELSAEMLSVTHDGVTVRVYFELDV